MNKYLSYMGWAVSLLTVLTLSGCATVSSDWAKSQREGIPQAYEDFLRKHPSSEQAAQARATLDDFAWKKAVQVGTSDAYQAYLRDFSKGTHSNDARTRIDDFAWDTTKREGTLQAYTRYLEDYPRSNHGAEARSQVDRMTFGLARINDSVAALRAYVRGSETGSLRGEFAEQAKSRLKELLRAAALSEADIADLTKRISNLAAPFSLSELYEECTKTPPKKYPNALFSFSGSSPEGGSGDVSTILELGDAVVSTKARRQPDKTPVATTIVFAVLGNRVEVNHIDASVSFLDLYNGFNESASKPRPVFTLRTPTKARLGGIGFEELEVYSRNEVRLPQRYIYLDGQWYSAD